jgi:hypothetical protein
VIKFVLLALPISACMTDPQPRVHNIATCAIADDSLSVGHPAQFFHVKDGKCVRDPVADLIDVDQVRQGTARKDVER